MITISDPQLFGNLVARAIKSAHYNCTNTKIRDRWIKAIAKATAILMEGDTSFIHWQEESQAVLILSDSNQIYSANGTCQCAAYIGGTPCYHRAMARLLREYYEAERHGVYVVKTFNSNFKGLEFRNECKFYFFDEAKEFAEKFADEPCAAEAQIFIAGEKVYEVDFDSRREEMYDAEREMALDE